ncbi:pyridoxal phosphate-dependent transferase [Papiliotrema laurentii]|uniref:Pyridoxal phosphate-dependent transferase n=1 Tax=Papiliotrema laurentii TaxID=5418 RepID=A0AAD9D032_PAPLA|nr:pyridoxal phosphate-dependent transferase [Papiliotrema laurentii]
MPVPVKTSADWQAFAKEHTARGLGRMHDMVVVKGQGCKLYTMDDKEYLDFTAGIGVTNLGHCHPAVTAAAAAQVGNIVHAQCQIMLSVPYLQLIERLLPMMPDPSLNSIYFWNSGTEAIEAAIKISRQSTGRPYVITFQGAYHGRTAGAGALTRSKPTFTRKQGPVMPGVYVTAYPYWHSLGLPVDTPQATVVEMAKKQLDLLFLQQVDPREVAAIFVEAVQGEGGYVPCPPEFLFYLRSVCDTHGIKLVVDEVQTGFGRTGKFFALQTIAPGLRPDIMTIAKGLANGFPLSGVVCNKETMDMLEGGSLGGTYAGNAVSCAAAVAVADVLATREFETNVAARSKQMFDILRKLQQDSATKGLIAEVRGVGLMIGVEFRQSEDPEKKTKYGPRIQSKCFDKGLLILTTSCFDTIRFVPALIVTEQEVAQAMDIFSSALREVALEG